METSASFEARSAPSLYPPAGPKSHLRIYAPLHRSGWLSKITEAGVRRRAEHSYPQLDALQALR